MSINELEAGSMDWAKALSCDLYADAAMTCLLRLH